MGLTIESYIVIMIVIAVIVVFIIFFYGIYVKTKEGISMGKQRFASVRSENYASVTEPREGYKSGLSGVNYNGGKFAFNSSHGPGRVINTTRDMEKPEGYLSSVTEGLNLIDGEN